MTIVPFRDSILDIAVANKGENTIVVMFGNGDGTFEKLIKHPVGRVPSKIIVDDFSNDKKIDLAVTNIDENIIDILLGNGDGTFQNQITFNTEAALVLS